MGPGPLLAFDTGSAVVSVAVGEPGRLEVRSAPQGRSSRELIAMIDGLLTRAGLDLRDLSGLAAARGPGSFTGLRVGLATALGLHQASGVRAGAVSTFRILATHYFRREGVDAKEVVAVVDALRDRWYAQTMRREDDGTAKAAGPPRIEAQSDLARCRLPIVGYGASRLDPPAGADEPPELAPTLLHLIADGGVTWAPGPLTEPLYLRLPATSPSSRLPGVPRPNRRRRRVRGST